MRGHPWRTRSNPNVVAEVQRCRELFPQAKEIFLDDDTFPWANARSLDICQAFKPLKFTWSCNSRVHTDYETLKAMKKAGLRLLTDHSICHEAGSRDHSGVDVASVSGHRVLQLRGLLREWHEVSL